MPHTMTRTFELSGPSFDVGLAMADYRSPPLFSQRVLIFRLPEDHDHEHLVEVLRQGLQETVDAVPILASESYPILEGFKGNRGVRRGLAKLTVKDLSGRIDYDELAAADFPRNKLSPADICPVGAVANPGKSNIGCHLQANLIRGGLLLVCCVNHLLMDGTAITAVLEILANRCVRAQEEGDAVKSRPLLPLSPNAMDRSPLYKRASEPSVAKIWPQTVLEHPYVSRASHTHAHSIDPSQVRPDPVPDELTEGHTFRMPAPLIEQLKHLAHGYHGANAQPWVSTHDAVCALIWASIMRARNRAGLLGDNTEVVMGLTVDTRNRTTPPLPLDYMGNANLVAGASLVLPRLLDPDSLPRVAHIIRAGISRIDSDYIENFTGVMQDLEDLSLLSNPSNSNDPASLFIVSHRGFALAGLDWGPALGDFKAIRMPNGYNNNVPLVLPVAADGSWEISLSLPKDVMEELLKDPPWMLYAQIAQSSA